MTVALEGGEWSAVAPAALYPRERPSTHFTRGWMGPRAGLEGRKMSSPPGFDHRPSILYEYTSIKLSSKALRLNSMSVRQQIAHKQEIMSQFFCILCYLTLHTQNVFILHSRIGFLTLEDWTDRLSRNVVKEFPLLDA